MGEPNSDDLFIGSYDDQGLARNVDGILDEVAIWSRPLSEAEYWSWQGAIYPGRPVVISKPRPQKKLEGTTAVFEVMVTGNGRLLINGIQR